MKRKTTFIGGNVICASGRDGNSLHIVAAWLGESVESLGLSPRLEPTCGNFSPVIARLNILSNETVCRKEGAVPELILNADDYGYSPAVNRTIEHLALKGRITSFTLMANLEDAAQVSRLAAKLAQEFSIGLHVNLTQGRPILERSQISSLVQADGEFFPLGSFVRRLLTGRIKFFHICAEILAQVRAIQTWLGEFSHFDSHQHIHRFPSVINAIAWAADKTCAPKRIRTNRRCLASGHADKASALRLWYHHFRTHPYALPGLYFKAYQCRLLRRQSFSSPDYLLTAVPPICAQSVGPASECWGRLFQNLPEATYELNWHPGQPNGEDALLLSSGFQRAARVMRLVSFQAVSSKD
jgi:predicted glycoside hydrolase/deacetylase ChbG (UPF0249 family)